MLNTNQESDAPLDDPKVIGVMPNISGGQNNLLERSALDNDVRVEFAQWHNSQPSESEPEYVTLTVNDECIERKKYTTHPISPADLFINVPPAKFREGRNIILYSVISYTGDEYKSLPYPVTADRLPHELAFNNEALIDPKIIQDGLTEQYLIENNGKVRVNIPTYDEPVAGDTIVLKYLNKNTGKFEELKKELDRDNNEDPISFELDKALILEIEDGPCAIEYVVLDRARNSSAASTPVEFRVSVARAPHHLPHPWIAESGGDPSEFAELNPALVVGGATGELPKTAVYYEEDVLKFYFGDPEQFGSAQVSIPWEVKKITVPAPSIAANFGKTVPVYYVVTLPDSENKQSGQLTLKIGEVSNTIFLWPQLSSPFSDPVSKATIPANGVPVHQPAFAYISESCLVTITVSGRDAQGKQVSRTILERHKVTKPQVTDGIRVSLPKDFMVSLKNDSNFTVQTQASFDGGARWISFPLLEPRLLA